MGTVIVVAIVIAVCLAALMLGGALAVSAAGVWFFHMTFHAAWHAAWAKHWVLLGWSMLVYVCSGGSARSVS